MGELLGNRNPQQLTDKLTRSIGQHYISRQNLYLMAFITVETKADVMMVKILSFMNQILLFICFMMMLVHMFMKESDADNAVEDGDDDESFIMERADAVSSLLPCLAAITMGAVVACGGRRVLLGIQQ